MLIFAALMPPHSAATLTLYERELIDMPRHAIRRYRYIKMIRACSSATLQRSTPLLLLRDIMREERDMRVMRVSVTARARCASRCLRRRCLSRERDARCERVRVLDARYVKMLTMRVTLLRVTRCLMFDGRRGVCRFARRFSEIIRHLSSNTSNDHDNAMLLLFSLRRYRRRHTLFERGQMRPRAAVDTRAFSPLRAMIRTSPHGLSPRRFAAQPCSRRCALCGAERRLCCYAVVAPRRERDERYVTLSRGVTPDHAHRHRVVRVDDVAASMRYATLRRH